VIISFSFLKDEVDEAEELVLLEPAGVVGKKIAEANCPEDLSQEPSSGTENS